MAVAASKLKYSERGRPAPCSFLVQQMLLPHTVLLCWGQVSLFPVLSSKTSQVCHSSVNSVTNCQVSGSSVELALCVKIELIRVGGGRAHSEIWLFFFCAKQSQSLSGGFCKELTTQGMRAQENLTPSSWEAVISWNGQLCD